MLIRSELPADTDDIHALHVVCFPTSQEAELVDHLRNDGDLTQSLIALVGGKIVAHIALSKMSAPFVAEALAPVAILPPFRNQGYAAALIRHAIDHSAAQAIFVLGDPNWARCFIAWSQAPFTLREI